MTNNAGTIQFILNEGGGTVSVVFEDGTTNSLGVLPKGPQSFALGSHTSFSIYVTKTGNGTPSLISTDADQFSVWNSPRGVAVNKNAGHGELFGRIYVGNSAAGGTSPNDKGKGLYALNADRSEALGNGKTAAAQSVWVNSGASGPWRMRVAPDNSLLVDDFSTAAAALWQFAPNFSSSNLVLSTVGQTAAATAGIHGDLFGTPLLTGSLEQGNLVLWTADSGMAVPSATGTNLGPGTAVGMYNCVFRYDIGSGPLPWSNPPNYAYSMGLDGIAELRTEVDIGADGKIICGFGRANLSNPNIQILDPTGKNLLWTSWNDTSGASDPWRGEANGTASGTYAGVRVSPDGKFLASVDINNGVTIANLTNGIPDDASIFGIANTPTTGNSRGMDWDAADNVYVISSGQGLLRVYSLGITTTCVTSNDYTGTNGSFQLILPPISATIAAIAPVASQNYVNNSVPGTPIPGVVRITLNSGSLDVPVAVNFTHSGTAVLNTNYFFNVGTDANGVVITSTNVTFPAGNHPGGGNWYVDVQVIPTATPVSGPTLGVNLRLLGGANYLAGTPSSASVAIQNTGPQLLFLSSAGAGTNMSRSVPNDYASFIITRWGDTNGPGNSPGSISPVSYTVTNFVYGGSAVFPVDYTAQAQRTDPGGNGVPQVPTDGAPGVSINPGNVTVTAVIGNPVRHSNLNTKPVNVSIIISPTNAVTGTNATSQEGYSYSVTPASVTLLELDNTVGPEVTLWSNPLTSSADSTNWTLTFAATNFASAAVLPVIIPNYTNGQYSLESGNGTNDFDVQFGADVANDGVPQSPVMAANGWNTALRMTVNKHNTAQAGVNLYPQYQTFGGNYALRFSMYLSMWSSAINNPFAGTYPREFALFGIDHYGTNCNWRTSFSVPPNPGFAAPTNSDGVWFAIDAGWGSITPADFDAFTPAAVPNSGVAADYQSNNSQSQSGVFKAPPFASQGLGTPPGGQPINRWVDVSVETTSQTNVNVYMNRSLVIPSFNLLNGSTNYTNGKFMLGYLDPVQDVSDSSAFVYFSDVRIVELSPYVYAQPASLIVTQGAGVSFIASANYATAPLTNVWFAGGTTPVAPLQTDTATATNLTSTLTLNNVQMGTNYMAVFSDQAGSVTGLVASLEVIIPPANKTVSAGSNFVQFAVGASGLSAPTYQWKTNGVNLANSAHYAGVTTSTLTITNVQLVDGLTYSCAVTNAAGGLVTGATLTVVALPPTLSTVSFVGTNAVIAFTTPNPYDNISSFTLQSSVLVQGPYVNTPATIIGSNGSFTVTVPLTTNGSTFYRLRHN